MKRFMLLFAAMILAASLSFSQSGDLQIGTSLSKLIQNQGALYDFSDPEGLNIKVAVWGNVKFPGKYIIPACSSLNDLISYTGGPTQDANLDDLRIYRAEDDSSQSLIKFNYDDLLWNKDVNDFRILPAPEIKAGDILLVPGEPRLFFKDYLTLSLAVITTVTSLAILILNIVK